MAAKLPSQQDEQALISDINVTPFVDVVLVLLVIFIITAPAIVKETLGIKLPKSTTADGSTTKTIGIAVNRQGQILVNGQMSTPESLKAFIQQTMATNPGAQAIISADQDSRHGDVVHAIDLVKSAGLSKFAIQIERVSGESSK